MRCDSHTAKLVPVDMKRLVGFRTDYAESVRTWPPPVSPHLGRIVDRSNEGLLRAGRDALGYQLEMFGLHEAPADACYGFAGRLSNRALKAFPAQPMPESLGR